MTTSDHITETPHLRGTEGALWGIGLICLVVAAAGAGVLALNEFLDESLPGCGPQSACHLVTQGVFGRVPWVDWPVSYLGVAYFIGLMVAWPMCLGGVPSSLRWLIRLGALMSFGWVAVMVAKSAMCPYCLTAHLGNFGFWIIVEVSARRSGGQSEGESWGESGCNESTNAIIAWMIGLTAVTIVTAVGVQHRRGIEEALGAIVEARDNDKMVQAGIENDTQAASDADDTLELLEGRWTWGPKNAPVQVVIFSDYQCPDCKQFEKQIQNVLDTRDDVSLTVKHFPMCTDCNKYMGDRNMHRNACWAARSVEAAGILGGDDTFWTMHHWLFDNNGQFPGGQLPPIVQEMGFDQQEFIEVMTSDETLDRVTGDIDQAKALGLFFTPMIFVNGVELKWYATPARLDSTLIKVADAIKAGRETAGVTPPPVGIDRFIADWQDNRQRTLRQPPRTAQRPGVASDAIEMHMWTDLTSPGAAEVLGLLRQWEAENGPVNLTIHMNPINHDCNPNLPDRVKSRQGSCEMAKALKAAMILGDDDQYWSMFEWLTDDMNGSSIATGRTGVPEMLHAAAGFGYDPDRFEETMHSASVQSLLDFDMTEFKRHRFRKVPSVLIEGRELPRFHMDDTPVVAPVLDLAVSEKALNQSP